MTSQPNEALRALVDKAEQAAFDAVAHVGAANYEDRQDEAERWVEDAFDKLRAELESTLSASPSQGREAVCPDCDADLIWVDDKTECPNCDKSAASPAPSPASTTTRNTTTRFCERCKSAGPSQPCAYPEKCWLDSPPDAHACSHCGAKWPAHNEGCSWLKAASPDATKVTP